MGSPLAPVCILAGGLGTRLGSLVRDKPKPLLPVAGEPFVFHQLRLLKRQRAQRVVICVGYLGQRIEEAVGDGSRFGLEVVYSDDGPGPIGTARAVRQALRLLGPVFFVTYGDTYLRIDYADVERAFRECGLPALMTVFRNEGRWDTSNVLYADGRVQRYAKHDSTSSMQWIDYGLGAWTSRAFSHVPHEVADLADAYAALARQNLLAGYEATHRFHHIGTPAALAETEEFLRRSNPA